MRTWAPLRFVAAMLLVAVVAPAQHYPFRHYGPEEGLNTAVSTLLQDHTGFLWVGTAHGLFRYDGTRFQAFGTEDGLPSSSIRSLVESFDRTLWIVTGRGLARFRGGSFEQIPLHTARQATDLHALLATPDGLLYVGSEHGLFVGRPDPVASRIRFARVAGAPDEPVSGIMAQGDGSLWFGCGLRLCVLSRGHLRVMSHSEGLPPDRWNAMLRTADGTLWVRGAQHLYILPPAADRFVPRDFGLPQSSNQMLAMINDRRGSVLVTTDLGLARWERDRWDLIGTRQGLESDAVTSVLQDREGAIWIGMWGAGVARWTGYGDWANWTTADGLSNNLVWAVRRQPSGALQVGTDRGLVELRDGRAVRVLTKKSGLGGDKIKSLATGPTGDLWVACLPGGVSQIDARASIRTYAASAGLLDDRVIAVHIDPEDRVWASTASGLYRSTNRGRHLKFERQHLPGTDDQTIFFRFLNDRRGRVWVGSTAGLYQLDAGKWRHFTKQDGLKADAVTHITQTEDGAIWLAYRDPIGMSRLTFSGAEAQLQHFSRKEGLPSDYVMFLGIDGKGRLWAGTDSGVAVRSAEGWHVYTHEDGLVWDDCAANAFWGDPDGSVWLGTMKGLSHFRNSGRAESPLPPPAVITAARFGDRPVNPAPYREVSFHDHDFLVSFSGLSFQSEKNLQFRYKLSGVDESWVQTSAREARYSSLSAGQYRFEVAARNPSGPWSTMAASLSFRVIPPWWQTWTFRLAAPALLLAAAVWAYRLRMRKITSEHHKLEIAVDERTAELQCQKGLVERQKQEIENLLRQSQEVSRLKSEFLANMSHEIRTPMNGVLGMTQLILATQLDEEQKEYMTTARESAEALLVVINDILDFSKIEAGKLELSHEPFEVRKCVADAAQVFAWKAREKGIEWRQSVSADVPDVLIGDAGRLRQVLLNLLGNAMKFTEQGSIRLDVRLAPEPRQVNETYRLQFSITDTGAGIPYDKQAMIFDAFAQADGSARRRQGGTGLGLAICAKLVRLMDGSICVESTPGAGSRFAFTAALEIGSRRSLLDSTDSHPLPGASQSLKGLRILLAEDNAVNQRLAELMLKRMGHTVCTVQNGREAVEVASRDTFDVIFMDVQMPEMDGFEATAAIRKREASTPTPRTPIIALTAHAMSGDREECLLSGMDGYLAKPIHMDELTRLLAQMTDHAVQAN